MSDEPDLSCGPTEDEAVCRCGCSGYDDRCNLYIRHYQAHTQVPESHTCCKIPGRKMTMDVRPDPTLHTDAEGKISIDWHTEDGLPGHLPVTVSPLVLEMMVKRHNDLVGFKPREEQSNLVDHAARELELIHEDKSTIAGYLKVIRAFADMGHSGGFAMVAIPIINELLQFKNLSPLTSHPSEWMHISPEVWGEKEGRGIWQSKRNPEAFSSDGGVTYTILSDAVDPEARDVHPSEVRK